MIPVFPESKKLEISDRSDIERITKEFLPYSDFNFTSMWSWDTHKKMSISKLHGNLVVRFTDYQTGEKFYSYLGVNKQAETVETLLDLSRRQGLEQKLRLLPGDSVSDLHKSFKVLEDRDNFDYVYDLSKLEKYPGNDLSTHRRFYKRFNEKNSGAITKIINIRDINTQREIIALTELWGENKKNAGKDVHPQHEVEAIRKSFLLAEENNNIFSSAIFIEDKMIAFMIDELLYQGLAINHFNKADGRYYGIFSYLMSENARMILGKQRHHLNFEQDLGLPGLRQAKKSFRPIYFLKKYTVELAK